MTFTEKVQSMSAHDIIMAMVEGLRKPWTDQVDMVTFGVIRGGFCVGCAATNAICQIDGGKHNLFPDGQEYRAYFEDIIDPFESAINYLRQGLVDMYNYEAKYHGFALIEDNDEKLPALTSQYTAADLLPYEQLAKYQLTANAKEVGNG